MNMLNCFGVKNANKPRAYDRCDLLVLLTAQFLYASMNIMKGKF